MPMNNPAEAAMDQFGLLMNTDPYLEYQPAFAYTLPIQLFVNGITLTLLAVLLMHLLCKLAIPSKCHRSSQSQRSTTTPWPL